MPWPWPMPDDHSFRALWDEPQDHDEDVRLAALVAQRLSADWTTRRQQITVMVQNRVVILTGLVAGAEHRRAAGELVCTESDALQVVQRCSEVVQPA
ncbi:BON domain-containing protein, partial [Micromonospora sp. NPDC051296]|uniref:BON domain-containing protein n=1 Tax=Micromonospora sp. NPDC051296 TaxID=3155046 RepID=UPI0034150F3B